MANIWAVSGPMAGIIGDVEAMVGGRGCVLTKIFKISIAVQRIFSDRTIACSLCSHSKSSEFNYTIVGKIMLSIGEGVAESSDICESDLKVALGANSLMPESV